MKPTVALRGLVQVGIKFKDAKPGPYKVNGVGFIKFIEPTNVGLPVPCIDKLEENNYFFANIANAVWIDSGRLISLSEDAEIEELNENHN